MADLVSIIIPCYNCELYVSECIESALNQSHNNIEIICINDGSTDGTEEILNKYSKKYENIVVHHIPNAGASAARNLGFDKSSGQYIQFLDADDILELNKIEKQLSGFGQDVDIVVSDYETFSVDLANRINKKTFEKIENNALEVAITTVISTINPLYRRSVISENRYNENLGCAQDWEFNLRLVLKGFNFKYVSGNGFKIRRTENSVSSNWLKVSNVQIEILNSLCMDIKSNPSYNSRVAAYIARIIYNAAVHGKQDVSKAACSIFTWVDKPIDFFLSSKKNKLGNLLGLKLLLRIDQWRSK